MREFLSSASLVVLVALIFSSVCSAAPTHEDTVKDLLFYCSTYDQDLDAKVGSPNFTGHIERSGRCITPIEVAIMFDDACPGGDIQVLRKAVVQWLTSHPQTARLKALDGVHEAYKALYPCH